MDFICSCAKHFRTNPICLTSSAPSRSFHKNSLLRKEQEAHKLLPTTAAPRLVFFVPSTARLFTDCSYLIIHNLNILEHLKNHINYVAFSWSFVSKPPLAIVLRTAVIQNAWSKQILTTNVCIWASGLVSLIKGRFWNLFSSNTLKSIICCKSLQWFSKKVKLFLFHYYLWLLVQVLDEKLTCMRKKSYSPDNIKFNGKMFIRIWPSSRSCYTTDLMESNAITVALIHFKCHCFKMPSVERASGQTHR